MSESSDKFKRKRESCDSDNGLAIKKRCVNNVRQNDPGTKNFANNRLKKLKDTIQEELKSRGTDNLPTTTVPQRQVPREVLSDKKYEKNISSELQSPDLEKPRKLYQTKISTSKDLLQDKDRNTFSPLTRGNEKSKKLVQRDPHSDKKLVSTQKEYTNILSPTSQVIKKNIANERLQNIRKTLNISNQGKNCDNTSNTNHVENSDQKISDSNRAHCSKTNEKRNVVGGIKRNLSDISNSDDECEKNSVRKKIATLENTKSAKHTAKDITHSSNDCDHIESDRASLVRHHYPSQLDNPSSSKDNRLDNLARKVPSGEEKQDPPKNGSNCLENILQPSSLPGGGNDSFCNKMAMTASWVMTQPQDVSYETVDLSTYSGNSLSVNANESTAVINFEESDGTKMEWKNVSDEDVGENTNNNTEIQKEPKGQEKLKDLCIVVDTNVFISGLPKIRDIMDMKITGPSKPLIYIPWMVLGELDFLKHSNSNVKDKKNVSNSITFIHNMLKQQHSRIIGQSVHDAEQQMYVGKSPDDKILACCLQAAERYEHVILLSDDINLKNKTLINNLDTSSSKEILMKIFMKLTRNSKSKKVMQKMSELCSNIICECAKEAYGDVWTRMDLLYSPPWTLIECLKRFKRYWNAIFRERLLKQFKMRLEDFLEFLNSNNYICDDSNEFIKLVKFCIELCIYFKDIEEFRGPVEKFLNEIKSL